MIKPTVGRMVDFWPNGRKDLGSVHEYKQPFAAQVAYVWNDQLINVTFVDHNGNPNRLTSVDLLQDDDAKPEGRAFCSWMPYQVGQAKKNAEPDPIGLVSPMPSPNMADPLGR